MKKIAIIIISLVIILYSIGFIRRYRIHPFCEKIQIGSDIGNTISQFEIDTGRLPEYQGSNSDYYGTEKELGLTPVRGAEYWGIGMIIYSHDDRVVKVICPLDHI